MHVYVCYNMQVEARGQLEEVFPFFPCKGPWDGIQMVQLGSKFFQWRRPLANHLLKYNPQILKKQTLIKPE